MAPPCTPPADATGDCALVSCGRARERERAAAVNPSRRRPRAVCHSCGATLHGKARRADGKPSFCTKRPECRRARLKWLAEHRATTPPNPAKPRPPRGAAAAVFAARVAEARRLVYVERLAVPEVASRLDVNRGIVRFWLSVS